MSPMGSFTFCKPLWVELEGIEPSSKRGNHMLSTCLSLPSVFVRKQDQSHQLAPYPLKFRPWREAARSYLRVCCTTISTSFGNRAFGWCLVSAPCAEIKPIYCASIRQRERKCFRQLIFRMIDIKVLTKQRTACLHTISARCQIQSTPMNVVTKLVQTELNTKFIWVFLRCRLIKSYEVD